MSGLWPRKQTRCSQSPLTCCSQQFFYNIQFVPQVLLVLFLPSLIAHTCCQFINQELGFERERHAFEKDRLRFEKERSTLMEGMHLFECERHAFLLQTQHLQNEVDKQQKEIAQHLLTINK